MTQQTHLVDLLSFTRDGEWGNGEPGEGHSPALVIRGTDFAQVRAGNLETLPLRYIRSDILARKAVAAGDTLIETAGGTKDQPTGRSVFIPGSIVEAARLPLICASFARFLRPDPSKVDPEFLFWKLQDEYESERMLPYHVQHTGVARFQYTQFAENYPLALPSLPYQRAIASVLGALDGKIELNRRMNETLEAMARAIFRDWFVDFGPTRTKAQGRAPYLAPEIWSLFPDQMDDEGKPRGWTSEPLLSHASLLSGGTPKTSEPSYWDGPLSWASAKDVSQCGSLFLTETERSITQRGLEESSTRIIPRLSTVIVARGATTGRFCMFGADMAMNQTCYALASMTRRPYWINCVFENLAGSIVNAAHGSVFDTITTRTFEQVNVTVPSPELLDQFEITSGPFFEKVLANLIESQTLAATRDLLLPKLMSGEIQGKEAERLSETASPEEIADRLDHGQRRA